jgi:hypothetical protein
MKKLIALFALLACAALVLPGVAGELKSGLQAGSSPPAFLVNDITGPAKGTTLCYRCRYGARPVVAIFTRKIDDNVAQLVKEIDSTVAKNEDAKMAAFVVLLSDNPSANEKTLADLAEKQGITVTPLTTFEDNVGPKGYDVSKDAEVNVMMWVGQKVKVNHAFAPGEFTGKDVKKVVSDTSEILN